MCKNAKISVSILGDDEPSSIMEETLSLHHVVLVPHLLRKHIE